MNNDSSLRKAIARNMAYATENDSIDKDIKHLETIAYKNPTARQYINELRQRRNSNLELMRQSYTDGENINLNKAKSKYYIKNTPRPRQYIRNSNPRESGLWEKVVDTIGHGAQGVTLGWSDEILGGVNGAGIVMANSARRAFDYPVNGENITDAYRRGYNEYVNFARNTLKQGMQRNPAISITSELAGSMIAPQFSRYAPINSVQNAVATGTVGGIGYANQNSKNEYINNIGISTITNTTGTILGRSIFQNPNTIGGLGRTVMDAGIQSVPIIYDYKKDKYGY